MKKVSYEIIMPGSILAEEHLMAFPETLKLLNRLEKILSETTAALNLFNQAYEDNSTLQYELFDGVYSNDTQGQIQTRRQQLLSEITKAYCEKHALEEGSSFTWSHWAEVNIEAGRIVRQERLASGILPYEVVSVTVFICARAFLFAVDTFLKTFKILQANSDQSIALLVIFERMKVEFPDLIGIRDSAHHSEDRTMGKARAKKIPYVETLVNEGQVMMAGVNQDVLNGTRYGNTLEDGRFAQIDVSQESLLKLQAILQSIVECFNWSSHKHLKPGF